MSTKLSMLCDRIIEAGWLIALIVTPLFFNVHSNNIFEPDKLTTLRSVALVMVLAWMIKGLETWRAIVGTREKKQGAASGSERRWSDLWSWSVANPLLLLVLLVFVAYACATITSIAPRLSLWGSYQRLQGLYTTGAYLVIFLSLMALLRQREQLDRLLTTVLVVSLPVSLYGIIQHFGTDPIPWGKDVTTRVASTLGNAIFVAAFLIMVVPLTLYRLLESARNLAEREGRVTKIVLGVGSLSNVILHTAAWRIGPTTGSLAAAVTMGIWSLEAFMLGKPILPFVRLGGYSVLLSTQLACLLLTQSRGPWLGLMVGVFVFGLLWTVARGKWRWAALITGCSIAAVLALVVVNVPKEPFPFMRHIPYAGRLSRVFYSGTSHVRMLVWQGAAQLVTADPLRAIIGYGPETMLLAYPPYYPATLGRFEKRTALPDRSHNEVFDMLVTTGFVGLALSLVFFTALIYRGLTYVGLLGSPLQRRLFLGLWCGGGIGAVCLSGWLDHSWRFFGVALPLGMLGGMFAYLGGYGFHGLLTGKAQNTEGTVSSLHLIVAALLSALVAHFVEMQFGIAIATTRTYFWTYAALLAVIGYVWREHAHVQKVPGAIAQATTADDQPRRSERRPKGRPASQVPMANGLRSAQSQRLISASIMVSCIMMTLVFDLLSFRVKDAYIPSILWIVAFTWVFAGLIFVAEIWSSGLPPPTVRRGLRDIGVYVSITVLCALVFLAVYKGTLRPSIDAVNVVVPYYVMLLFVFVASGVVLLRGERLPARALTGVHGLAVPVLLAIIVSLIVTTNINVVRADIYYKRAQVILHRKGKYDQAIARYRQALALQPSQDFYYLFLGKAFLEKSRRSAHTREREALLRKAEKSLMKARDLNRLHPDHTVNLARLYRSWAEHADDPEQRTARMQDALAFYERAIAMNPNSILLWNEWGTAYALMGNEARALETYRHALSLDDTFAPTYLHLGDLYGAQEKWKEAAKAYEQAIARHRDSVRGRRALGAVYAKAVRANQRVLALEPNNLVSHRRLILLHLAVGEIQHALTHVQRALEVAPPKERAAIEKLIAPLRRMQRSGD